MSEQTLKHDLGTIRIEGDGLPGSTKIYLDGHEVANYVRSASIFLDAHAIPSVSLELVGHVELSDEIKALVEIYGVDDDEGDGLLPAFDGRPREVASE